MKDLKDKEKIAKDIVTPEREFKGYTIEEIRFQRALVAMEADFCKTKILKSWDNIQGANPLNPTHKSTLPTKAGSLALKMFQGLNYVDYVLLGLSIFKGSKKLFSIFRRKKR